MTERALPYPEKDLVEMFFKRVDKYSDYPALSHKKNGQWLDISWKTCGDYVNRISRGLTALGLKAGQPVCVLAANRPEWIFTDVGIIGAGGITVGIYASNLPAEVAYVVGHSDAVMIVVEDEAQLNKVLAVKDELPLLQQIIMFDPPAQPPAGVMSFNALLDLGEKADAKVIKEVEKRRKALKRDQVATYVYTSGTTGPPKGAMITHANLLYNSCVGVGQLGLSAHHQSLSFLPLAHLLERYVFWSSVYAAAHINFAENMNTIAANMVERRPHVIIGVPRVYEKIYERIMATANEGPAWRGKLFNWGLKVGTEYEKTLRSGKPLPFLLELQRALANRLIYGKLREKVGGRIFYLGSGGAPLAKEIAEFFTALGMPVIEAYGLTETTAPATMNTFKDLKPGTVGKELPGVQVKIAPDGEILIKGPNVFKGYLKNPEATAEALQDGWFYSGDIGRFDEDGFLVITDRKKDLIITAGGKNVAPQNIENLFKLSPYISQMMVFGDRKKYLAALFTLNQEELEKFAAKQNLSGLSYQELTRHPAVQKLVKEIVEEKNSRLARFEQIKKYIVLDHDFSQATGEMTPTMKLKRKIVTAKYQEQLEALYLKDTPDSKD